MYTAPMGSNPKSPFTTRIGIQGTYSFQHLSPNEDITIGRIQSTDMRLSTHRHL